MLYLDRKCFDNQMEKVHKLIENYKSGKIRDLGVQVRDPHSNVSAIDILSKGISSGLQIEANTGQILCNEKKGTKVDLFISDLSSNYDSRLDGKIFLKQVSTGFFI